MGYDLSIAQKVVLLPYPLSSLFSSLFIIFPSPLLTRSQETAPRPGGEEARDRPAARRGDRAVALQGPPNRRACGPGHLSALGGQIVFSSLTLSSLSSLSFLLPLVSSLSLSSLLSLSFLLPLLNLLSLFFLLPPLSSPLLSSISPPSSLFSPSGRLHLAWLRQGEHIPNRRVQRLEAGGPISLSPRGQWDERHLQATLSRYCTLHLKAKKLTYS